MALTLLRTMELCALIKQDLQKYPQVERDERVATRQLGLIFAYKSHNEILASLANILGHQELFDNDALRFLVQETRNRLSEVEDDASSGELQLTKNAVSSIHTRLVGIFGDERVINPLFDFSMFLEN